MEPRKRTEKRVVKPDWLSFLYDEVLLYCENDDTDFSGYNLNTNRFLAKLEKELDFSLIGSTKEIEVGRKDVFYYSSSDGKIESWFKHLRNAIAHNRIFKLSDNDELILEDVFSNKITMYAEISSFDKLKQIISKIKENYKKE